MREILFRGRSIVTGKLVYGDLFQHGKQRFIMHGGVNAEVDPETVGQYTGLTDKNGVKIFEGDLIAQESDTEPLIVKYEDGIFIAELANRKDWIFIYEAAIWEIVGNIYDTPYDTPELLGGDDNAVD